MKTADGKIAQEEQMDEKEISNGKKSNYGLPKGWTRTTLVILEDQLEILKEIAWFKKTTVKELVRMMLDSHLSSEEMKEIVSKLEALKR